MKIDEGKHCSWLVLVSKECEGPCWSVDPLERRQTVKPKNSFSANVETGKQSWYSGSHVGSEESASNNAFKQSAAKFITNVA